MFLYQNYETRYQNRGKKRNINLRTKIKDRNMKIKNLKYKNINEDIKQNCIFFVCVKSVHFDVSHVISFNNHEIVAMSKASRVA